MPVTWTLTSCLSALSRALLRTPRSLPQVRRRKSKTATATGVEVAAAGARAASGGVIVAVAVGVAVAVAVGESGVTDGTTAATTADAESTRPTTRRRPGNAKSAARLRFAPASLKSLTGIHALCSRTM